MLMKVTANISVAVAVPIDTVVCAPVASAVTSAGGVTTGGIVVSPTVMFCVAVPVLPAASVAVHVTTVVPTGNVEGASLLTERAPSTRSVAVAVPMDTVV